MNKTQFLNKVSKRNQTGENLFKPHCTTPEDVWEAIESLIGSQDAFKERVRKHLNLRLELNRRNLKTAKANSEFKEALDLKARIIETENIYSTIFG